MTNANFVCRDMGWIFFLPLRSKSWSISKYWKLGFFLIGKRVWVMSIIFCLSISHASILNDNKTHTSTNPSTHLVDWTRMRTQMMFQISDRERVYLEDFARFYKNKSVMKKKKSHFRLGKFLYIRSSEFRLDRLLSIIGKP